MAYTLYKVVNFGPGRAGLATVGYTLTGGPRVTAGVAEVGTATGTYGASISVAQGFAGSVLWDTGQGASTVYAGDDINPLADVAAGPGTAMTLTAAYDPAKTAAQAGQIPANFTSATFASAGVFAAAALANAPAGGGGGAGGDVNVVTWLGSAVNPLQTGRVDAYLGAVGTGPGTPLATIAAAVRDVDNTTPAANSLGAGVNDKAGYALAAAGLDAIDPTEPVQPSAAWNFRQWLRWSIMSLVTATRTPDTLTVKTRAGATSTTQAVTDDGAGNESTGVTS